MTDITLPRELVEQVLEACEQRLPLAGQAKIIDELNALQSALSQSVTDCHQLKPLNWTIYNTGAEVATVTDFDDAWDYLTDERLDRGWCAVCVIDKSNLPYQDINTAAHGIGATNEH